MIPDHWANSKGFLAFAIIGEFEKSLERHNIKILSEDREGKGEEACIHDEDDHLGDPRGYQEDDLAVTGKTITTNIS